jgi:hypothetical protein
MDGWRRPRHYLTVDTESSVPVAVNPEYSSSAFIPLDIKKTYTAERRPFCGRVGRTPNPSRDGNGHYQGSCAWLLLRFPLASLRTLGPFVGARTNAV